MSSEMAWRAASLISGGRGKIGKALGQIDGVVLHGQARHFADDGFGELLGLGGEHAAGDCVTLDSGVDMEKYCNKEVRLLRAERQ